MGYLPYALCCFSWRKRERKLREKMKRSRRGLDPLQKAIYVERTVRHISTRVIKWFSMKCALGFERPWKTNKKPLKDFYKINTRFLTLSETENIKNKEHLYDIYRHIFHNWFSKLTHFIWPSWSICTATSPLIQAVRYYLFYLTLH